MALNPFNAGLNIFSTSDKFDTDRALTPYEYYVQDAMEAQALPRFLVRSACN